MRWSEDIMHNMTKMTEYKKGEHFSYLRRNKRNWSRFEWCTTCDLRWWQV